MVSKAVTGFLCFCCWLHGATIGVAVGDSLEVYRFFALTCGIVVSLSALWSHSSPMRRMAASLTYLVCTSFIISIVKSIAWFRTPQLEQWTSLPDIGHDIFHDSILAQSEISILGMKIPTQLIPNALLCMILFSTFLFICMHPLRIIITRRLLIIYSTILLARAICAIMTYLPDSNPDCPLHKVGLGAGWNELDVREVVRRMLLTIAPAFVSSNTFRLKSSNDDQVPEGCRDIIFSGHTAMVILCAMTWHTY